MTLTIILITCVVSLLAFRDHAIYSKLIFNPYIIYKNKEWFRFIGSGLIHADAFHLLVNVFVLYVFGSVIEESFEALFPGKAMLYYLMLYVGGMMASVIPSYLKNRNNPGYNALGASGAVSAVVFSYILLFPLRKLCLYGILCLPGIIFGALYLFYCYYMGKKGRDNINHDAHMWGAIYGFFFTVLLKPQLFLNFFDQVLHIHDVL